MKTTADLKALMEGINAEVAAKRAAEEADRAAEVKGRIEVVMQLLSMVVLSPKAATAVREQIYSVPEVKASVRGWLRNEFLGFSVPLLPHAAAQIAAAIGEISEVSVEKFAEIRKRNDVVYEHRKTAHAGKWEHGCSECTLEFVYDSKADGVLHRYIAQTTWARMLMKERYDRNRLPLLPKGKVGMIGEKMIAAGNSSAEKPAETPVSVPPAESREVRRAKKFGSKSGDGPKSGRPTVKPRGGASNLTLDAQSGADNDE